MGFTVNDFLKDGIFTDEFKDIYRNTGFGSDLARARGPFVMYLLSERGFSYEELKAIENGTSNITQAEKEQLFSDFMDVMSRHPLYYPREVDELGIPHPDMINNARMYGRWAHNGIKKIMNDVIPKADDIKNPNDAFNYLNNFSMLSWYVKDIVQEYEGMWKNPETSGPVLYEMGEEEMGRFSKVELVANTVASLNTILKDEYGDKYKAMFYPVVKDFIDEVAGKSFDGVNQVKLLEIFNKVNLIGASGPYFINDEGKNDPKYTKFLETGEADFDVNSIKYMSSFARKEITLKEGFEGVDSFVDDIVDDMYNHKNKDFTKLISEEKIKGLLNKLPGEIDFKVDAPEDEREAIRNLYMNTACNLYDYYINAVNYEKGFKSEDLIKVDGKSLASIVDKKYQALGLTKEQRQTAIEYEFAAALTDKEVKLEYAPYVFQKKDRAIIPGKVTKVTQYDVELDRTYEDSVNLLMDQNAAVKNGKSLYNLLVNAENTYHKLYNDSNKLTDSTEFKRMLGSFKEIHEVYQAIKEIYIFAENEITDEVFNELERTKGYTKEMFAGLLKETAKNCNDYITAKNASGKYRSTDKGNDRLMSAAGFLNDLDSKLATVSLKSIKLRDAEGNKVVRKSSYDDSKRKMSFKDLMDEGENERSQTAKKSDNSARASKKRMQERSGREAK